MVGRRLVVGVCVFFGVCAVIGVGVGSGGGVVGGVVAVSGVDSDEAGFLGGVALLRGAPREVVWPVSPAGVVFRAARLRGGGAASAETSVAVGVPACAEPPVPVPVSDSVDVSVVVRVPVFVGVLAGLTGPARPVGPGGPAGPVAVRSGCSWPSVGEVLPAATLAARLRVVRRAAGVPGAASRAGGPSVPGFAAA
ncbi:hypothetical protein ABZ436_04800 [Micromonospora matsumotoense]|uniref:hypothetical protein n=1 Tax=Micromonospora matsumotoense TaxID=121616 RepID=UPI003407FDF3